MQSKENLNHLIDRIVEAYGVTFDDICSLSRKRNIVSARSVLCYIMRFKIGYTCEEIGVLINRHHSTISRLSSSKKIDELILKICG